MNTLVIIITFNAMKWVDKCLSCVDYPQLQVYVVDNGSTDGTPSYIKSHYPSVLLYQSLENLGFGRANNIGLQYAIDHKFDYVYLLNQDAWIFPETIGGMIKIVQKHPEYGILSPFQMEANMEHLDLNFKKEVCTWKSAPDLLDNLYLNKNADLISVTAVMAAHWLISRECLLKVGGFSPTFRHYGEDNNYADRALYWGFKIGIVPSLKAVHDRENRPEKKSDFLYLSYVQILRMLSKPGKNNLSWIGMSFLFFKESIKNKSIKPLRNWMNIINNYKMIRKNKDISCSRMCAFLTC